MLKKFCYAVRWLGVLPACLAAALEAQTTAVSLPASGVTYSLTTTYVKGAVVQEGSTTYISLQPSNLGHDPATNPTYWVVMGGGGTGNMSNPMTTTGDLVVGGTVTSGTAAPTRLAAGTTGYVLTSNGPGAAPSYQQAPSAGPSNLNAPVLISTTLPTNVGLIIQGTTAGTTASYVQSVAAATTAATMTAAFSGNVQVGSAIIVALQIDIFSGTLNSLTDSQGNSYSLIQALTVNSRHMYVYAAFNCKPGPTTVTAAFSSASSNGYGMAVGEYAGVVGASAVDGTPGATESGSGTAQSVGPVTTTVTNDLLVSAFSAKNISSATASGFTNRVMSSTAASPPQSIILADGQAATLGNYSANWTGTWESSSNAVGAILIALKSAPQTQTADLIQLKKYDGTVYSMVNALGQTVLASTSGSPSNVAIPGTVAFDPSTKTLYAYAAGTWNILSTGGSGGGGGGTSAVNVTSTSGAQTVNLSTEGTYDWFAPNGTYTLPRLLGALGLHAKATGKTGGQLYLGFEWVAAGVTSSPFTQSVGSSVSSTGTDDLMGAALSASTTGQGLYSSVAGATGYGYKITLPVGVLGVNHTLRVYTTVYSGTLTCKASLSDGAAGPATATIASTASNGQDGVFTVTYTGGNAGQILTVLVTLTTNLGATPGVKFQAATLQ